MVLTAGIRFPHLGIEIGEFGKSFSIFGFDIAYYGVIIGIGMIVGILMAIREAKKTGQDPNDYIDLALYGIICAIIGCRIYYVVFEWGYYKDHLLEIFDLRKGGLAIYGGIIGAVLCTMVLSKIKKIPVWRMLDTGCTSLIAGQIIGRWGNFANREAFGGYTDGLLTMQIRVEDAAYTTPELLEKMVTVNGVNYIQVHPTFLYESLWNLGVLIILLLCRRHKKFEGEVFLMYAAGYGIGRAWIEGLRTDQLLLPVVGLPVSQILSIVVAIVCIGMIVYKRLQLKKAGSVMNAETAGNDKEDTKDHGAVREIKADENRTEVTEAEGSKAADAAAKEHQNGDN